MTQIFHYACEKSEAWRCLICSKSSDERQREREMRDKKGRRENRERKAAEGEPEFSDSEFQDLFG